MDPLQDEFETAYQAFVEAGGLDAVHVLNEDYERSIREQQERAPRCPHGLTPMLCKHCG